MVQFNDVTNIQYNKKKYSVIKVQYKGDMIPIVLDNSIYNKIKNYDKNWLISPAGSVYTMQDNKMLYLHEIVYILHNEKKNKYPLVHLNKIGLDNRIENLIEDAKNKQIKKNLNKKSRTIQLENINVDKIPSFVWYLKSDDSHGERFQVDLGDLKWKTTSCDKLSLKYKLEEAKKFLRQYKTRKPEEFMKNSMNSDLNTHGIQCKKDFYKIINRVGMNYECNINDNTSEILKCDESGLSRTEKKLLKEFDMDSNITTYERFKEI
jgi:hypothetical protein